MVKKFRKKPVEIEAIQWTGENFVEITGWSGDVWSVNIDQLIIPTLEGKHYANVGDWIIKGIQGEFYPCKPDIFEQTYETVEPLDE